MTESSFYSVLFWTWLAFAPLTFCLLLFVPAPYGRNLREGWGPTFSFLSGWVLMEFVAPLGMVFWYVMSGVELGLPALFLGLWLLHYLHRTFVYAWVRRERGKPIPLGIVLSAFFFNVTNTYLIGRALFSMAPILDASWLATPQFLVGLACFMVGLGINLHADHVLFHLRKPGESGYKIPTGGLYRWVSCPNYLGEIIEWFGWAVMTGSGAGLAFAIWTVANLGPRAITHHRWYQDKFPDYPKQRKALLPWLL